MPTEYITPATENAARETMQGEWDADGTATISIPFADATALLTDAGWRNTGGGWISPNGHRYWTATEALAIELVARVR